MLLGAGSPALLVSFWLFLLGISHTSKTVQPLSFGLLCSEQPRMLDSIQKDILYIYTEKDFYSFDTRP